MSWYLFGVATGIGLGGVFRAIEQWDQRRFRGDTEQGRGRK